MYLKSKKVLSTLAHSEQFGLYSENGRRIEKRSNVDNDISKIKAKLQHHLLKQTKKKVFTCFMYESIYPTDCKIENVQTHDLAK